jgi:hypothetical protein
MEDLINITSQLSSAHMTEHGQLLCYRCYELNAPQLKRAGVQMELVPCHGTIECTLCGLPATAI